MYSSPKTCSSIYEYRESQPFRKRERDVKSSYLFSQFFYKFGSANFWLDTSAAKFGLHMRLHPWDVGCSMCRVICALERVITIIKPADDGASQLPRQHAHVSLRSFIVGLGRALISMQLVGEQCISCSCSYAIQRMQNGCESFGWRAPALTIVTFANSLTIHISLAIALNKKILAAFENAQQRSNFRTQRFSCYMMIVDH